MIYTLPDHAVLVAHNETARVVYILHSDYQTVSVFTPDLEQLSVVRLNHQADRFTHYNAVTCWLGVDGATVMLGDQPIKEVLALGPHRFLNGELVIPKFGTRPDVRGEDFFLNKQHEDQVGTTVIEKAYGIPKAAERYRGFTAVYFTDYSGVFSVWGDQVSPAPDGINIQEKVLGEVYTHPHLRLTKIAVQDGWIFSVDDGKLWRFLKQDGWPIALSDTEVWLVSGKLLYKRGDDIGNEYLDQQ